MTLAIPSVPLPHDHVETDRAYSHTSAGPGHLGISSAAELFQGSVVVKGQLTEAVLWETGLSLQSQPLGCQRWFFSRTNPVHVFIPAAEVVAAQVHAPIDGPPEVRVYHLTSGKKDVNLWTCSFIAFSCATEGEASTWKAQLDACIARQPDRPKRLLVFVNPFSGRRMAMSVWETKCLPLLELAGIESKVVVTKASKHAQLHVETMSLEDASSIDGILVVGGDGLFQEVLTGLLNMRCRSSRLDAAGRRLRMGHIPGGSTDGTAYSMYGCRSAEAATLHAVLGDRMWLDVVRVTSESPSGRVRQQYCINQLSYGFLGDVMQFSEMMRCFGPARYDLAGCIKFVQSANYQARIAFRTPEKPSGEHKCSTDCPICKAAVPRATVPHQAPSRSVFSFFRRAAQGAAHAFVPGPSAASQAAKNAALSFTMLEAPERASSTPGSRGRISDASSPVSPAKEALAGRADVRRRGFLSPGKHGFERQRDRHAPAVAESMSGVKVVQGRFKSILVANMPLRTDKSKKGLLPSAHLSDGCVKVLLIRDVNTIEHLCYMARMSSKGLTRPMRRLELVDATEVEVEHVGEGAMSAWNVDGEIVTATRVRAEVLSGLVQVFARGLDCGSMISRSVVSVSGPEGGVRRPARRYQAPPQYYPQKYDA